MAPRLPGVDNANPRLPQLVIDATKGIGADDLAAGDHVHTGTDLTTAVASSPAGDGPQWKTAAVYSGNGFAGLAVRDPNTLYVIMPTGGGQGSLYLGNTLISGPLLSVPGAVPAITATPGDTQVVVGWGTPSSGGLVLSGYIVQRSTTEGGTYTTVATLSAATHSYTNTGLTNGTTYWYRVLATNAMGNSAPSQAASAIPVTTTATALSSSDTTSDAGTPVIFTATVTSAGVPVTTGSVSFRRDGNNMITGVPVNGSGVATFTTSSLPIGSFAITAVYDGGSLFLGSTSNTVTQDIQFAGGPAPTTAVLVSDDASSAISQPVTFTVTVARTADGVPVTSGTIVFRDGGTTLTAPLTVNPVTGVVTYTTSVLTEGTHSITAVYSGAPFYENATSNVVSQVVAPSTGGSPIAQTMYSSKPLVVFGEQVSLRTTVRSGTSAVTSGTVEFFDGVTSLGAGTPLNLYGESFLHTYDFTVGTHTITAEYSGAPVFENDVSTPFTQTVVATIAAPSPNDWLTAFSSGSLAQITAWYDYNTGHLAEGFDPADLWNPAGVGSIADVWVDDAWLTANEGPNVVDDGGGHWTITGIHTSQLQGRRSHLTFNHCWIERRDYENVWGGGFVVYEPGKAEPKTDNVTLTDFTLNYCTFTTDGTGGDNTFGDAMLYNPATPLAGALTFNYCEVTQWTAAFKIIHSTTVNYCWVHDLDLFGFDPHNTSASIRGRQNRINRNLLCDGTSSDLSLYADTNPYTDFWVTENVMWINPVHQDYEVNFPNRGTGWSPLLPGYQREFTDNKLERGRAADNQYWSKISGNTLITGEPLFGGATTVQVSGEPTLLAGPNTAMQFGASQTLVSFHYTPTPSSTLLYFIGIGRANHVQIPNASFNDESGALWSLVPGCDTPVEIAGGNLPQYGMSAQLWKQESTSTPQAFRRVTFDPYPTNNTAYMSANIVELTGVTGLTLVQAPAISLAGHLVPFGGTLSSITSGMLGVPATPGNFVMLFVGYGHAVEGSIAAPAGWEILGNNIETQQSAATLWRTDFSGRSVTLSDVGPASIAVTILCEFSGA